MFVSLKKLIIFVSALLLIHLILQAEEDKNGEQKVYFSSTSFSMLYTSGNTQELTIGFDTEQNLKFTKNLIQFKGSIIFAESDGAKESEFFYSHAEYKRDITSKAYILGFGRFEKNDLAGYKYRFSFSVGGGYFWKRSEKLVISSEGAFGWNAEKNIEKIKNSDITLSFASFIISNKLRIDVSSTTELIEHIIFFLNLEETKDYRISWMTSLSVNISKYLALKLSYQLKYNHDPVPGFKSTDNYLLSSLVLNF